MNFCRVADIIAAVFVLLFDEIGSYFGGKCSGGFVETFKAGGQE
jgi:hypothetical protein